MSPTIRVMNSDEESSDIQYAAEAVDYLLGEIEKNLRAMLRIAKWAANTDLSDSQRRIMQNEIDRLIKEVDGNFAMLTDPPSIKN